VPVAMKFLREQTPTAHIGSRDNRCTRCRHKNRRVVFRFCVEWRHRPRERKGPHARVPSDAGLLASATVRNRSAHGVGMESATTARVTGSNYRRRSEWHKRAITLKTS
jgi:hypothetical protein